MNIDNLKQNKCPKCSSELNWDKDEELLKCESESCSFNITEQQFTDYMDEVISREYKINSVDDNLKELNNL